MTHLEVLQYMKHYKSALISDETSVYNLVPLWQISCLQARDISI